MKKALCIIFGILFILAGLGAITDSILVGGAYFLIAALLIPTSRQFIERKTHLTLNTSVITVVIFILLIVPISVATDSKENAYKKELAKKENEAKKYFEANKTQIMTDIDKSLSEKNYDIALQISEKYLSTQDLELFERYGKAKKAHDEIEKEKTLKIVLERLKTIPEKEYQQRADAYQELLVVDSKNTEYTKKRDFYLEKVRQVKEAEIKKALSSLRKKTDEMEGITWYSDLSSPQHTNNNGFYLYFGKSQNGKMPLRLRAQYYGDDWLFINSFFVVADGQRFDKSYAKFDRDHYTSVWEWYDEPMTTEDKAMIEAIIKSKKATIRYNGNQYHDDRTITSQQKAALKNVLNAYEHIN